MLWLPLTEQYSVEAYFPTVNFKTVHTVDITLDQAYLSYCNIVVKLTKGKEDTVMQR